MRIISWCQRTCKLFKIPPKSLIPTPPPPPQEHWCMVGGRFLPETGPAQRPPQRHEVQHSAGALQGHLAQHEEVVRHADGVVPPLELHDVDRVGKHAEHLLRGTWWCPCAELHIQSSQTGQNSPLIPRHRAVSTNGKNNPKCFAQARPPPFVITRMLNSHHHIRRIRKNFVISNLYMTSCRTANQEPS